MKIFSKLSVIILLSLSILFYILNSYDGLYYSFSLYLLINFLNEKKINSKFFSFFFFMYFAIPFPNISTYRGEVLIDVLAIYAFLQFFVLFFISMLEYDNTRPSVYYGFKSTALTEFMFYGHIAVIYSLVAYVYAVIGIIIVRQDLRFTIPPMIEYMIKSGLVLPLLWMCSSNFAPKLKNLLKNLLLPIIPSLLIGSRGTFVMILISVIILLYMYKIYGPQLIVEKYKLIYKNAKTYIFLGTVLGVLAVYMGFYIRRDGVELITANELLVEYSFTSSGLWVKAILPLYIGLRESVGITNRIIVDGVENPVEIPLFLMEMMTFLPGHQEAPGIILARDIYMASGTDEKYSLTPGILGGLYIDYGFMAIPIVVLLASLLILIYNKGISDIRYRLIYAISVVQFFHLYHRGFLKLEYFVPYFIVLIFLFSVARVKIVDKPTGEGVR